jgi:aminopeptidase-like protein
MVKSGKDNCLMQVTDPSVREKYLVEINSLFKKLFPLCRSITGQGVRDTLELLKGVEAFTRNDISSGTDCYDWRIPQEWNIREAYIADEAGNRIIDFQQNNLHVVSYSAAIDKQLSFEDLEPHLHTLPDYPQAIPYRTSYYHETWGFCLTYEQYLKMDRKGTYRVRIDSKYFDGKLDYGEALLKGKSDKEFLIHTYCCHPSLANDNLSGMVLWILLLRELKKRDLRHNYRFVIVPESIGSIAYLSQNEAAMQKIAGALILTTVAGHGAFGYKQTYLGNHLIDQIVTQTFREAGQELIRYPFDVSGSDEKHYSCPYFRIPAGTITKNKYYEYREYHTSMDNLDFVSAEALLQSLNWHLAVIDNLERMRTYESLHPYSQPMLGKRGLYPKVSGHLKQQAGGGVEKDVARRVDALNWVLFYGDGKTPLSEIAERSGFSMQELDKAVQTLLEKNLLRAVGGDK